MHCLGQARPDCHAQPRPVASRPLKLQLQWPYNMTPLTNKLGLCDATKEARSLIQAGFLSHLSKKKLGASISENTAIMFFGCVRVPEKN